jgi:non-ribosomal peptide synthetase component E (peptide arylation enzyme)
MTLGEMLHLSAARNPRKPAIICGEQIVSYEALDQSTAIELPSIGRIPSKR